ncbi:tubulin epsilon and delta complex protein 2 isoform X2 [Paroedura picta]|uniref:tubulin epsilon and delta complex protein 2 isoform X2 n=1 Tax=Paroedura picta TaxID=143630 RepID=UPI0040562FE0
MLPADSARRLVSLLTEALEECAEKQAQLQQGLAQCRAVLGNWNSRAPDSPSVQECTGDQQGKEPSAEEVKELELLNKALEKALKIQTKFLSPVPPREAEDGTEASEKKPMAHVAVRQQGSNGKESASRAIRMTVVSPKPASPRKPSAYALKAPYRTDPGVKRPRGKTPARLSCKGATKKALQGAASAKAKVPTKITKVECRKISGAEHPRMPPGKADDPQDAEQGSSLWTSTSRGDIASIGPPGLGAQQCLLRESTQASTLQEKGCLLKLPLPYRKASSKLARLWEEGRLCQTSPEAAAERDRFVEKLQATFCSPSPPFSLVGVEKELISLRGVYSLLRQGVESEAPASLGENPNWEREYESLLALEGIQPAISECLDKLHQLQGAVESHVRFLPADATRREGHASPMESPFLPRPRQCGAEKVGPLPPLCYSSLEELQQMEALRLQVAFLSQQIAMQQALEEELLPLLEPGSAPQDSRASLYRAIYTLLCEGGQRFPALVSEEGLCDGLDP